MSELIDVIDENNNFTGIKKTKLEAHKNGLWHRAAHIWIYNSKGEILLQLRGKNIDLFPNKWDISVAGHVSAGEEPIESGIREFKEELGLDIKKEDLEFFKIKKDSTRFISHKIGNVKNNEFCYLYFFKLDNLSKIKIDDDEVQDVKFLHFDKLEKELRNNPDKYVPHGDYWFEIIEKVRNLTTGQPEK
jgi:isopentenyldiphosphate isomerase